MQTPTFITGNQHKVVALERLLGRKLENSPVEVAELQELDFRKVVKHKAIKAYALVKVPILVEDVSLVIHEFGRWPGTYIKQFLEELGDTGVCRMLDGFDNRAATATVLYGLYDGKELTIFEGRMEGSIPERPRGEGGSGWDAIFIPKNSDKTLAEANSEAGDKELSYQLVRTEAASKLKTFLDKS